MTGNLWKMPQDAGGITGFSRDFGYDLEKTLKDKGHDVDIYQSPFENDGGYYMTWVYKRKHSGNIMITKHREAGDDALTIDRFLGIKFSADRFNSGQYSTPSELREAAQIYDEVTAFLKEMFDDPVATHDGRSIYGGSLTQKEVV